MKNPPTSFPQGKKLLEQVSDALRIKHYSYFSFRRSAAEQLFRRGASSP